jgi:hypothetical protein
MATFVNVFFLLKSVNEVSLKHTEKPRKGSSWSYTSAFFGQQIAVVNGRGSHGLRD